MTMMDPWFAILLLGLPAILGRLTAPSCMSFENCPRFAEAAQRARWQALWRSFSHSVFLVYFLVQGYPVLTCARFVFWYMMIDFFTAFWETGGNLKWDNWLHHGSAAFLTAIPLLDPSYEEVSNLIGPPLLWMEWTTILLNLCYFAKTYQASPRFIRLLKLIFIFSFFGSRCLYLGWFLGGLWLDKRSIFWVLPPLGQLMIFNLGILQWIWFGLMVKKLIGGKSKTF